ncbi:DUF1801 domain-containing protein [uncultured Draconibacterium sp.]|uniref:DUF1801 domain-containing protein n=1 Tax=uncultured Draconibacterium sp. TaxID=1573823 RepID=UPI0025D249E0|nr:DUF1801 domain-containing protein [uncultured Draconibacterium sp.]
MEKHRKPLSTKKPPVASNNHTIIEYWMANGIMPGIQPVIKSIDKLITDSIPNLQYAIKWSKAYYGSEKLGWFIELAAYHVSANIVFLSGASFNPKPPLGNDEQSRYIKVNTIEELNNEEILDYIEQAGRTNGWK